MRTLYPFHETVKLPTGEIVCYFQMRWFDLNADRVKKKYYKPIRKFPDYCIVDSNKMDENRTKAGFFVDNS